MTVLNDPAILRRFDAPDEVRHFEKGKFEIVHIGDEPYVSLHFLGAGACAKK